MNVHYLSKKQSRTYFFSKLCKILDIFANEIFHISNMKIFSHFEIEKILLFRFSYDRKYLFRWGMTPWLSGRTLDSAIFNADVREFESRRERPCLFNLLFIHTLRTEKSACPQHPTSFLGAVACPVIRLFGQEWDESRHYRSRRTQMHDVLCLGNNLQRHLWMSHGTTSVLGSWLAGESEDPGGGCRKSLACANIPVQLCFCGKSVVRFDVSSA